MATYPCASVGFLHNANLEESVWGAISINTHGLLIEAPRLELLDHGWNGISVDAIRRRAGALSNRGREVGQSSWTHFFPKGKEQAAIVLWQKMHERLWRAWIDVHAPHLMEEGLVRNYAALVAHIETDREEWRLFFELEDVLAWSRDADIRALLEEAIRRDRLLIAGCYPGAGKIVARVAADESACRSWRLVVSPIRSALRG